MRRGARFSLQLLAAASLSFLWVPEASAYVDPGVGSYLFQLLIAVGVGALFAAKVFFRTLMAFLAGRSGRRAPGRPAGRSVDPRDSS